jgi:excisionase family DNA binding protein
VHAEAPTPTSKASPEEIFEALEARISERVTSLVVERVRAESTPKEWLTTADAASYLACSPGRIRNLVSGGRIPSYKEGGRRLFRRSELDDWVVSGRAAS